MRLLWNPLQVSFAAVGLCCAVFASAGTAGEIQPTVSYDRQVLPILSDNCYKCHGPDEAARKAHLRLDTKEGAFAVIKGVAVISPGKPADSELVRRITSTDPDKHMPPAESHRSLTAAQVELIKTWVQQGAKWELHWSFVPPVRLAVPEVKGASGEAVRNAIDAFVLARLQKEGLKPAGEAKKETLLRRVTLDLTGVPPTPQEVNDFIHDDSANAYEKVVDRLLASPRYGERMASIWLDLARYADTHGYQADRYRPVWPYRDWVIKAFNQNLPYDQFVTWQLAGDLLRGASKEQRLATAFNRLHMQNEEGGIVEEEFRVAYNVDRVDTFGTAFLGLTFECTRCHDHKFDPLTQKDFYSLFAFFQNVDESGQTSFFTDSTPVPTLLLTDDATDTKLADLRKKISEKHQEMHAIGQSLSAPFGEWLSAKGKRPETVEGLIAAFDFASIKDGKIANSIDASKPGHAVENPKLVEDANGKAAQLTGENGFTFPGIGNFTRADPFTLAIRLKATRLEPRLVVVHHSKAPIDAGSRGYELLLEDGHVAFGLHHMWPGNSLKVVTRAAIAPDQWTPVTATYDGSSRASGIHIYLDGHESPFDVIRDGLYKDITYGGKEPDLTIGYRFRDNGFKGGAVRDFRVFDRALTPLEAAAVAGRDDLASAWNAKPDDLSAAQRDALFDYFTNEVSDPARQAAVDLRALRAQENALVNSVPEIMVMQELPQPKPAYILKRGAYDAHGDEVHANTPAVLPPLPAGERHDRLALAHWLFRADNPLTARVEVNRLWQQMFGRGIVESSDNFGSQGSPPTHPELLDWLAVQLQQSGWDTKGMLKLIAMSATYRQSSKAAPELLASDPDNRLLARGSARRLTAEMLRDQELFDAGLLVEKLGGPSVKPYQPPGLWDVAAGHPNYDQGHGDDLHRRSLYTYWKRSVPPPAMIAFDSPDRNYCVARRQSTSTPLQALALLNDIQVTESARLISQRAMLEGGPTVVGRIDWMFRLITDRPATKAELSILNQMYDEQRAIFAADLESAKKLLAVGEAKNDQSLDPVELATGSVLAEAILNHDEAVMRR
jgi:mono/diheme cytochrome c family protein